MVKSIQIGDDSDSDDDDDEPQEHNQILWAINLIQSDTSIEDSRMKDFHAWIIANQPDTFGPTSRTTRFTDDEIKPLKKTHNYKALKKDSSAPWFEFISNNA